MTQKSAVVASRNSHKVKEIRQILRGRGLRLLSLSRFFDAPRVKENGKTLDANARKKALAIARFTGRVAIADDSGLFVDALGGRPGVKSARFAGKDVSYRDNNLKLLKLLEGVPPPKRKATFICKVAIAHPGGKVKIVEGRCSGIIGKRPKGRSGFGYDPLFIIPRSGKTFAELGSRIKNRISHRSRAFRKTPIIIKAFLKIS